MNSIAGNLHTKTIANTYFVMYFPITIENCFQFMLDIFCVKSFHSKLFPHFLLIVEKIIENSGKTIKRPGKGMFMKNINGLLLKCVFHPH